MSCSFSANSQLHRTQVQHLWSESVHATDAKRISFLTIISDISDDFLPFCCFNGPKSSMELMYHWMRWLCFCFFHVEVIISKSVVSHILQLVEFG